MPTPSSLDTHPDEYRAWAYELWAYVYSRNAAAVARRLADPEEGDPLDAREVPARTINRWCQVENWPERVSADIKRIAPNIHETVTTNMLLSTLQLSNWALDVANDRVALETFQQQGAAKLKLDLFRTMADRTGFMPWMLTSDRSRPEPPTRDYAAAIGSLSMEELEERMYGALPRVIADAPPDPEPAAPPADRS